MTGLYRAIPVELRELVQWVGFRFVPDPRKPKPRKLPFQPRGPDQKASSTDPATWAGFDEIADRSRTIKDFTGWESFCDGAAAAVDGVRLDPWDWERAPLVIVESESLAGLLEPTAYTYRVPLVPSRGQTSDSLVYEVARLAQRGHERVLYVGDFDLSGGHIEDSFRDRAEALSGVELDWRRVALTRQQVEAHDLPVIPKWDGRRRAYFDAVETEALDQTILLPQIDRALADLLPEAALDRADQVERQARQLAQAAIREALEQ